MWHQVLAQPDSLTLPGYGLAGIVIAGLSTACLKLYNRVTFLTDEAIKRERQINDETIPLLIKGIDVLKEAAPHLDPVAPPVRGGELESAVRRLTDLIDEVERRERMRGS